jgi:hypothetical protein
MRGKGVLFATLGALGAVAVVVALDLPAAARSVSFPTPGGNKNPGNLAGVSPQELEGALVTLGTGANTIGGPGTFSDIVGQGLPVFEVQTGAGPDACITVRNLSVGDVKVLVTGANEVLVDARRTRTSCYSAPTLITLRCDTNSCAAVWRVDRQ